MAQLFQHSTTGDMTEKKSCRISVLSNDMRRSALKHNTFLRIFKPSLLPHIVKYA